MGILFSSEGRGGLPRFITLAALSPLLLLSFSFAIYRPVLLATFRTGHVDIAPLSAQRPVSVADITY